MKILYTAGLGLLFFGLIAGGIFIGDSISMKIIASGTGGTAVEMITTSRGLECVRHEPCGLSCNWPKFNESQQEKQTASKFSYLDNI